MVSRRRARPQPACTFRYCSPAAQQLLNPTTAVWQLMQLKGKRGNTETTVEASFFIILIQNFVGPPDPLHLSLPVCVTENVDFPLNRPVAERNSSSLKQ